MPKNKGEVWMDALSRFKVESLSTDWWGLAGKGGKNRRRGKNETEVKRELVFKEDGQGIGY